MAKLTRNNIALNLSESPYTFTITYKNCVIEYAFSSEFYKNNYINRYKDSREYYNESISRRFGFTTDLDILSDLKLYTSIEKRGFLIYKNGVKIDCPESITFAGLQMTLQI